MDEFVGGLLAASCSLMAKTLNARFWLSAAPPAGQGALSLKTELCTERRKFK
jgi:hypothetical protein